MISDMRKRFNPKFNPLYEHAEVQLFLCSKDGKPAGRMAVAVDYRHNECHSSKSAQFGLFDCINDENVAFSLFDTATQWAKEKGMTSLQGPHPFSCLDESGLLIEGFDSCPMIHTPYNPNSYIRFFQQYGFNKEKDLVAYHFNPIREIPDRLREAVRKIKGRHNTKIRNIDMSKYEEDMMMVLDLYNKAWSDNWNFLPLTEKEMRFFTTEIRTFLSPDLVCILEVDGHPVGFGLAVPDFSQAFRHLGNGRLSPWGLLKLLYYSKKITAFRLIRLGLLKEYRFKGLDAVINFHLWEASKKHGFIDAELSLIPEDDLTCRNSIENLGAKMSKRYRIYSKKCSSEG
jgi:hypothetical protein